MVKEVDADTLAIVIKSWESLKMKDGYEKKGGALIMKYLFQKCPKAKPMFGYDLEADIDDEFLAQDRFIIHATEIIGMFDQALAMMGPDGKLLEEKIRELGESHVTYGVRAHMFPIMGKALQNMLQDELGDDYNGELRDAWNQVFRAISTDLMTTVLKASKELDQ